MPISEAKHKANEKYNAKAYDEIKVRVPKGRKEAIQTVAEGNGESVNGFINRVLSAEIERLRFSEQTTEQAVVEIDAELVASPVIPVPEVTKPKISAKSEVEAVAEAARRMLKEQFEAERRNEMLHLIDNRKLF